jgi:hypothetical protein
MDVVNFVERMKKRGGRKNQNHQSGYKLKDLKSYLTILEDDAAAIAKLPILLIRKTSSRVLIISQKIHPFTNLLNDIINLCSGTFL